MKETAYRLGATILAAGIALPATVTAHEYHKDAQGRMTALTCHDYRDTYSLNTTIQYAGDSLVPVGVDSVEQGHDGTVRRQQIRFDAFGNIVVSGTPQLLGPDGQPLDEGAGQEETYSCVPAANFCATIMGKHHSLRRIRRMYGRAFEGLERSLHERLFQPRQESPTEDRQEEKESIDDVAT